MNHIDFWPVSMNPSSSFHITPNDLSIALRDLVIQPINSGLRAGRSLTITISQGRGNNQFNSQRVPNLFQVKLHNKSNLRGSGLSRGWHNRHQNNTCRYCSSNLPNSSSQSQHYQNKTRPKGNSSNRHSHHSGRVNKDSLPCSSFQAIPGPVDPISGVPLCRSCNKPNHFARDCIENVKTTTNNTTPNSFIFSEFSARYSFKSGSLPNINKL